MTRLAAASILAFAVISASPTIAQSDVGQPREEKINQLYIYGDDECPESKGDEIVVCARLDEGERYRIPKDLRDTEGDPTKESFARRVLAYEYVGSDGIQSCSAAGAGGFTGCGLNEIDAAYAEKKQDPGKVFGRLIAKKRAERLAQIDAEAEEVEKRVVAFEQERAAREAASDEELAAEAPLPQPE